MKEKLSVAMTDGFMYYDGKIRAYRFESANLNFKDGLVEYTCKIGGKATKFASEDCPKVYACVQDYKAGVEVKPRVVYLVNAVRQSLKIWVSVHDTKFWCIKDNVPISVDIPQEDFVQTKSDVSHAMSASKYFRTEEEASLYCDCAIVDADGVETIEPSVAKRIALSDEQKRAVEALSKALRKVKDLGVGLTIDTDCEDLFAYSKKQIKSEEYDAGGDIFHNGKVDIIPAISHKVGDGILCCSFDDFNHYVEF